ncbi:MAG: ABC transporter ATP-binding protein/permease [Lachnospiraceae bacterium]|nr:ABC transporter ATP-binding protein/permease [Lachnospiraceae bacterium]
MDTSGFVPKGNLNTDSNALARTGKRRTIKRVLEFLSIYRVRIIISLILAAISVAFTLLVPICIGRAIDMIGSDGGRLAGYIAYAAVFALIVGISQYAMNLINNSVTYNTVKDIRNAAIEKIEHLPLSYIDQNPQGDIVSRIVADADQFAEGLLLGFTQAFSGIMTILCTFFFMLSMNVLITLVVVFVTPLSIFIARFISSRTYSMFQKQSIERGAQTALIDEMIGNAKVVKAFSKEEEVRQRFDEINERLSASSLNAIFFSSLTNPSTRFVNAICYALVALCGATFCISGESIHILASGITVGTLTIFLAYANQYTKPFNEISSVISELQNALACAARVFEILDEMTEETDKDNAELSVCNGQVTIKDVDFSYTKDKELIKNLNISVTRGQRVAIVGPTGCGKTTIINLLMRFYDVDDGSISVDGCDIRTYTRKSLRSSYGMVLQDTWTKRGTVMENIRMARPDATDEEVIRAAKETSAHGFIRRLEKGYDTMIGEDGAGLSAGQKQLLCITRVMLNIPPMLILDEATSSIDTRTEMKIQSAFTKLMKGRTSFIVAHRLRTVRNADIILVMRDGKIIEQGDHETLIEKDGFYKKLYTAGITEGSEDYGYAG